MIPESLYRQMIEATDRHLAEKLQIDLRETGPALFKPATFETERRLVRAMEHYEEAIRPHVEEWIRRHLAREDLQLTQACALLAYRHPWWLPYLARILRRIQQEPR